MARQEAAFESADGIPLFPISCGRVVAMRSRDRDADTASHMLLKYLDVRGTRSSPPLPRRGKETTKRKEVRERDREGRKGKERKRGREKEFTGNAQGQSRKARRFAAALGHIGPSVPCGVVAVRPALGKLPRPPFFNT